VESDADEAGYVMALIQHRCPEIADMVVPAWTLQMMLEVVAALEAKVEALQASALGQGEAAAGLGASVGKGYGRKSQTGVLAAPRGSQPHPTRLPRPTGAGLDRRTKQAEGSHPALRPSRWC
jgi:hypothetical protein